MRNISIKRRGKLNQMGVCKQGRVPGLGWLLGNPCSVPAAVERHGGLAGGSPVHLIHEGTSLIGLGSYNLNV